MPTRELKRIWCKTCQEFELHEQQYPNPLDWFCKECETGYTKIKLKDIPNEKIIKQRERYKKYKRNEFRDILGMYTRDRNNLLDMFAESEYDEIIRESDAGQKNIDDKINKKREEKREKQYLKRQEEKVEMQKYHKLGRNDLCLCGSNKKFKYCCWKRIQSYG